MPKETITMLIMSAPTEQMSRAQIIYQNYQAGNITNATCTAIIAARETRESNPEWSALCGDFAANCMQLMDSRGIAERMSFMGALLDMAGEYIDATLSQIDQAIYLACTVLVSGADSPNALQQGIEYLHNQQQAIGQHS
ncbi:MAG: hypothetical protein ACXWT0_00030 [Methylobacter sp.]